MSNQLPPDSPICQQQEETTEQVAKRNFIEKFIDKEVIKLIAADIKPKLNLVDGVNIEIRNCVLSKSTDPAQQAFLSAAPEARILSTGITVSGDTGSLLTFGSSFSGNINGSYEVQIELPDR